MNTEGELLPLNTSFSLTVLFVTLYSVDEPSTEAVDAVAGFSMPVSLNSTCGHHVRIPAEPI